MATNEENNLIGYDPLAWMEGEIDKNEDHLELDETESDNELPEQQFIDSDINVLNDYPEDLIDDDEGIEIVSAPSSVDATITNDDEFKDQSETVMTTEMIDESVDDDTDTEVSGMGALDDADCVAEEAGSQVDLDATLSIQNVLKLHEKLKLSLAMHDQIEINASDVASIDTATLQLLVSLKKDAVKLGKQVSIIYPSPRFIESARLLGLLAVLDVHDV